MTFTQTEIKEELSDNIKEEPVSVPLGPDDPMEEEHSWDDYRESNISEDTEGQVRFAKGSSVLQPPPALHPVVSSSSLNHGLPLGFICLGSYGVQSGGQAWENSSSQLPEPNNQEASPSASQAAMVRSFRVIVELFVFIIFLAPQVFKAKGWFI